MIMNRLIYLKEVVDQIDWNEMTCDIYATADGSFDEKKSQLILRLDCFAKSEKMCDQEKPLLPVTLPSPQIVRETMSRDEASEATKEIFGSWVKRIQTSLSVNSKRQFCGS